MRRRDFIKVVAGSGAAWPLAARAQQRAFPVVALLSSRSPAVDTPLIAVIRQGLNETGFVEGQNIAVLCRSAQNVRFWHKADVTIALTNVGFWG